MDSQIFALATGEPEDPNDPWVIVSLAIEAMGKQIDALESRTAEMEAHHAHEIAMMAATHKADVAVARAARAGMPDDAAWREIVNAVFERAETVEMALRVTEDRIAAIESRHAAELKSVRAEIAVRSPAKRAVFEHDRAGRVIGARIEEN